jgi:hypothetical protein
MIRPCIYGCSVCLRDIWRLASGTYAQHSRSQPRIVQGARAQCYADCPAWCRRSEQHQINAVILRLLDAPTLLPGTLLLPATACATLHLKMVQLISAKLSGSPPHRPAMGKQLAARVISLEKSKVEHGYQNIEVCWQWR